jgi:hypothetical protein
MTAGKVVPSRLLSALLCVCAVGLLTAGLATAAEPDSMSEAKAMGDPAASAPTAPTPELFTYEGGEISEAAAISQGLACMQTLDEFVCKDSTAEFGEAEAFSKKKNRNGASASLACGVNALWVYQHKQYEGWALGVGPNYNVWVDIVGEGYNNATTSYRTGEAAAHLSDFWNGGGWWYPGGTGYCDYHSNISQPYPEWNDRISSRYRY